MNSIKNLQAKKSIVFENDKEDILILIQNETNVLVTTDKTDFNQSYEGIISELTEDGLSINESDFILWEYIESIEII